jgi:hypothetical protein
MGTSRLEIDGYDERQITYHVKLMGEGNLLQLVDISTPTELRFCALDLTWESREFLELARHETTWLATKNRIQKAVGGIPYDILKESLRQNACAQTA